MQQIFTCPIVSDTARHQELYHGKEDGLISQEDHSLVESEKTLAMTAQWCECSSQRGNTDPDLTPSTDTERYTPNIEHSLLKNNWGLIEQLLHYKLERDHIEKGSRDWDAVTRGTPPQCGELQWGGISPCGLLWGTVIKQWFKGHLDYTW